MTKRTSGFQMGNKEGMDHRFTPDRQPKKRGRKPSLYRYIKKNLGSDVSVELSKEDFLKIIQFIMEKSPNELEKLVKNTDGQTNKDTPVWMINIISAINKDIKCGRTTTLELLLDRVLGRSTTVLEGDLTTASTPPDFSGLSTEELLQLNTLLEKSKGKTLSNTDVRSPGKK